MTLYTLICSIETANPTHRAMIARRISPEVSFMKVGEGAVRDIIGQNRAYFAYQTEEDAALGAAFWNEQIEGANFMPAKVTFGGEIKYSAREILTGLANEISVEHSDEELLYTASAVLASVSAGLTVRVGLEAALLNNFDPAASIEKHLTAAGVLGLISLGFYVLSKIYRVSGSSPKRQTPAQT